MERICIIGVGRVGSTIAHALLMRGANIIIYDKNFNKACGEAQDLADFCKIQGFGSIVWSRTIPEEKIYIVTAGKARTPEMKNKIELWNDNLNIMFEIFKDIKHECSAIIVTNPSTELAKHLSITYKNVKFIPSGHHLDQVRAEMVFGDDVKVEGSHSNPIATPADGMPNKTLVDQFQRRSSEIISLKGCTQFGVSADVLKILREFA